MTSSRNYTDLELLEAIRRDDEKAFAVLFQRYWKLVHTMAYARVRSREVTEEIVQELFASLWDKRATNSIQHLPSWLYQAVKFKALNYVKSKIVEEKYWQYYKRFVPGMEDATDLMVDYQDLLDAMEAGMKELPQKSEQVFRLHRIEGCSVPEIASRLNLSEKAIQYHLTQSVKKLRVHLRHYILSLTVFLQLL